MLHQTTVLRKFLCTCGYAGPKGAADERFPIRCAHLFEPASEACCSCREHLAYLLTLPSFLRPARAPFILLTLHDLENCRKRRESCTYQGMSLERVTSQNRRKAPRVKLTQPVRVRPLDNHYSEEICNTENVSKNGLYFKTSLGHYYEGMNASVTRNFQADDPMQREEAAKVVRVERLSDGRWGVAIRVF